MESRQVAFWGCIVSCSVWTATGSSHWHYVTAAVWLVAAAVFLVWPPR
jgi:hypothetical protein